MKTIDTYIKEAFIRKDNIKQIRKSDADDKPYLFVPIGGDIHTAYNKSVRFADYDELIEYLNNSTYVPNIFRFNNGKGDITDIHTEINTDAPVFVWMPKEYKELCPKLYKLRVDFNIPKEAIDKHLNGMNYFIGNINCSAEELK